MKGKNRIWVGIGVILAVVAFGLSYYAQKQTAPPPPPVVPANGQPVVIAAVNIPAGTQITPSMLSITRIKGLLPYNAYTSCLPLVGQNCGTTTTSTSGVSSAITYYAAVGIAANTVITQTLVSGTKVAATPSFGNLNLPPGDVALALPLSSQETVAGYLQAGDRIDIIATTSNGDTTFAFEDLPVISVGGPSTTAGANGTGQSSASGGLIVLQVTRSQALGITEMEKNGDIYDVVLRSPADYGHGYIPTTTTPANGYTQSCTPGTKVNPIIEQDLLQANASVAQASQALSAAQKQYNAANSSLQSLPAGSSKANAAKQQVLADSATVAQDQFSLIQANNEVQADEAVLYCGASNASAQSQNNGLAQGSPQMLQNLFGSVFG